MAKIGILTCSNATQELGCSSVSCLSDFRNRKGTFADNPQDEKLSLMGIINCPRCPTLTGPDKLLQRIRSLRLSGLIQYTSATALRLCVLLKRSIKQRSNMHFQISK